MTRKRKIILASASKRRSQILGSCRIRHRVVVSHAPEEHRRSHHIAHTVVKNAEAKAGKIAPRFKDAVIIGADTLVSFNRRLIGKPRTKSDARKLLKDFSGKRMAVFTGLCVIDTASGKSSSGYEMSYLYTKKIDSGAINRYLDALAPYDKAGGFSIEGVGSLIFDNIRGSYFNILGLPMTRLDKLFKDTGLDMLDFTG